MEETLALPQAPGAPAQRQRQRGPSASASAGGDTSGEASGGIPQGPTAHVRCLGCFLNVLFLQVPEVF